EEAADGFGDAAPVPAADGAAEGDPRGMLLLFLSPLCETCQHVVDPLNALADDAARDLRLVAVIRADRPAYEAFLSVFPLRMPSLRDHDRALHMGLNVHRAPFGLLYDEEGILVRKGLIESADDLSALLGDASAPEMALAHVYPRVVVEGA